MGIVNGLGIRSFSSVKVKVLLRELHGDHHPRFSLRAQGGKYCNLYNANVHGLKSGSCRFWPRTDSPPGSNMLRLAYADSGSACKLAGVQIIPLPTLANQILARTFFRFRHASVCVPSRWKVLSGEFHRPPDFRTLYGLKWARSVEKRHGVPVSEARRCSACANPFACPAVEKFCRASSAGGRLHLQ